MKFFNSLSEPEQNTLLAEFEASLNPFCLKRYKIKGLKGVKIPFAGFCAGYEKQKSQTLGKTTDLLKKSEL